MPNDKAQKIQEEYEKFLNNIYELKKKKLEIISDLRKKSDKKKLDSIMSKFKLSKGEVENG